MNCKQGAQAWGKSADETSSSSRSRHESPVSVRSMHFQNGYLRFPQRRSRFTNHGSTMDYGIIRNNIPAVCWMQGRKGMRYIPKTSSTSEEAKLAVNGTRWHDVSTPRQILYRRSRQAHGKKTLSATLQKAMTMNSRPHTPDSCAIPR